MAQTSKLSVGAVFFDLDDTLCDNAHAVDRASDEAIAYICSTFHGIDPVRAKTIYTGIFAGQIQYVREAPRAPDSFQTGFDFRVDRFNRLLQELKLPTDFSGKLADVFGNSKMKYTKPFPEVPSVLSTLKKEFSLGIITNGYTDLQKEELETLGLAEYFDHVLISQQLGSKKPDERIFRIAMEEVNLPAQRVMMVGDNMKNDLETPLRLGMPTCLVLHGRQVDFNGQHRPDLVIDTLEPLPAQIAH